MLFYLVSNALLKSFIQLAILLSLLFCICSQNVSTGLIVNVSADDTDPFMWTTFNRWSMVLSGERKSLQDIGFFGRHQSYPFSPSVSTHRVKTVSFDIPEATEKIYVNICMCCFVGGLLRELLLIEHFLVSVGLQVVLLLLRGSFNE